MSRVFAWGAVAACAVKKCMALEAQGREASRWIAMLGTAQPKEGNMDFDEWFYDAIWRNEDFKTCLRRAWEAATEAEREACAKVCEKESNLWQQKGQQDIRDFRLCAAMIRMRSNA